MPQDTRRSEPEKSCGNRISRRHDRTTPAVRNYDYVRNVNGANKSQMFSQANHTRIPTVHWHWWKRQVCQISDHTKERAERRKQGYHQPWTLKKDFTKKRLGYFKWCIHTRFNVPLVQIKMNRLTRHVTVDRQIVIRMCANESLKYHKNQDIEALKSKKLWKWLTKKLVATTVSSRIVGIRRRMEGMTMCSQDVRQRHTKNKKTNGWREQVEAGRVTNTLMVTFQCACVTKAKMMNLKSKKTEKSER